MSKRSNSSNNAKKARQQSSPGARERQEDARARGQQGAGAGFDNKSRNAAAERFDRDVTHSAHGAHAAQDAPTGADRAGAARAGGARDEARAKNRER